VVQSATFFYQDDRGPHGLSRWSSVTIDKNEVHVDSLSDQSVTFRIDISNTGSKGDKGWIRGKVTAKVCKIEE
jgi:hypothetical protein